MKKALTIFIIGMVSLLLVSCETTEENCFGDCGITTAADYLGDVHDVLESEGFSMNESVVETELQALSDDVYNTYSLSVTAVKLQYGEYTDAQTTIMYYADVVQLSTSTQAQQYYDELLADSSVTCLLFVYHDVVVKTDSQDAYDALNNL